VEHYEDDFYIITNADGATNFKIVKTKVDKPSMEHWQDFIPHRENVLLEGFEIFKIISFSKNEKKAFTN
jgi:oligopeptidase B